MELHHLHVGNAATRAPRHRDAVARRAARRGGEQVGAPCAAGGEDRRARGVQVDAPRIAVDRVDAPDVARARIALFVPAGGQVDRDLIGDERDVGMCLGGALQRLLHRPAGGVGDMDDAAVRMAALAGEVQRVPLGGEGDAELGQPLDRGGRVLDDEFDDVAVVEARAGDHRVLDMVVERVAGFEHRGDSPLCPGGRPFVERALRQHGDAEPLGEGERRGEAGGPRSDDQDVAAVGRVGHCDGVSAAGGGAGIVMLWHKPGSVGQRVSRPYRRIRRSTGRQATDRAVLRLAFVLR